MAYKNKGNSLITPKLQAGYTIENDGYGLLTSRLVYKIDQTRVESNAPKKGDPHPKDPRLKAWKIMWTRDQNDLGTITGTTSASRPATPQRPSSRASA